MTFLTHIINFFRRGKFYEPTDEMTYVNNLLFCADKEVHIYRITQTKLPTLSHYQTKLDSENLDIKKIIQKLKRYTGIRQKNIRKEVTGVISVWYAGREEVNYEVVFKTDQSVELIKVKG